MYFDEKRTSLREYMLVDWLVERESGYCFQPFIFYYIDLGRAHGLSPFAFDRSIWRNRHFCDGFESVTEVLSPAGDDFESVTERSCVVCGASIEEKRSHSVTCGAKCRKAYSRKKLLFLL